MIPSPACYALVKRFESCRLTAFQDQRGVWTIGWGRTLGVKQGGTCTQQQADAWLVEDLSAKAAVVDHELEAVPTTQNEFDAMVSLAYNIGAAGFGASSVLRDHRDGFRARAADAFLMWDKIEEDGVLVVSDGLHNRREAERAMYLGVTA